MKKIFSFFFLFLLIFGMLMAQNYGGIINVGIPSDVAETLDPHKATGALTFEILYNVYEALITVDTKGNLIPALAKEWNISDDGLEYIFDLRSSGPISYV